MTVILAVSAAANLALGGVIVRHHLHRKRTRKAMDELFAAADVEVIEPKEAA